MGITFRKLTLPWLKRIRETMMVSVDPDMVVAHAMQNYQKAYKVKFKANKRQLKMLQHLDADEDKSEQRKGKDSKTNKKKYSKSKNNSNHKDKKWEATQRRNALWSINQQPLRDDEEGPLYLHQENRIKAHAYYVTYGESVEEPEP